MVDGVTRDGVSVGRVFGRSVQVIRDNPLATLGTAFILIALPQLVTQQFLPRAALFRDIGDGLYGAVAINGLLAGLLWLIAGGALIHATVAHDQGRKADLKEVVQIGITRCLPLFAVYLLYLLGTWLGMILFFVPGIMLAVMWSVSLPVIVAERAGVFGAFGRSRFLTRGARWHIFGILLLALMIYLLIAAVSGVVSVAGYGSLGALTVEGAANMPAPSLFLQLVQAVVTSVLVAWLTTMIASLFIELRHWKDGPDADRLADIFA